MKIIIYRNREVYKENSKIGNDSENKVETLDFEFPEEFKDFNKYIEFQIKGEKCVDLIQNNQYVITRSIAKYGKIKTQIVLKKIIDNDTVVFKSNIFTVNVSASINASEEMEQTLQVDIIQTLSQNISEIENKVANLEKNKADKEEIPDVSVFLKEETDPTVPDWAKQKQKPKYTASEIAFEDGQTFQEKYNSGELNGKDGEDYRLTEADKQEIIEELEQDISEIKAKNTEQDKTIQNNTESIEELKAENALLKSQIPKRTIKWREYNIK